MEEVGYWVFMMKVEREREREVMWSVGAKDRPRVFWGLCMCAKDKVGAKTIGFTLLCWSSY